MAKSWYDTGYDGAEEEEERRSMGYPPDRWWVPEGDTKEIVYVDDDPFCIHEHTWKDSNDSYHHATCLAKINEDGCPACVAKGVGRADYTGFLTVIDITGYVNKHGEEFKYQLKALPAKTKFLNKMRRKKENRGSLLNQLFTLTRADRNTPRTGDELDHVREIDWAGLYPRVTYKGKSVSEMISKVNAGDEKTRKYLAHHFDIPESGDIPEEIPRLNYVNLYAPLPAKELRRLCADAQPFNSGGGRGSGAGRTSSDHDDIPF